MVKALSAEITKQTALYADWRDCWPILLTGYAFEVCVSQTRIWGYRVLYIKLLKGFVQRRSDTHYTHPYRNTHYTHPFHVNVSSHPIHGIPGKETNTHPCTPCQWYAWLEPVSGYALLNPVSKYAYRLSVSIDTHRWKACAL